MELTEIVPTTANVFEYAQIVKNKAVLRGLIKAGNQIIACGYNEDGKLSELLEKSEKTLFGITQTFIKNKLVHINDILTQRFEEFAEIHENPDLIKDHRLQLGFKDFDDKCGGLKG
jgi:replicative DNA helicase